MNESIITKILLAFDTIPRTRAGLVRTQSGYRVAFVNDQKSGPPKLIATEDEKHRQVIIMQPVPVHTALYESPAILKNYNPAPLMPEQWIEQNQSRTIPAGMHEDQISCEYRVHNGTVFQAVVSQAAIEPELTKFPLKRFLPLTTGIALWDLALLYGQYIKTPFILLKVAAQSSVVGLVSGGVLQNQCNFWAGAADWNKQDNAVQDEFLKVVESIRSTTAAQSIIVYAPESLEIIPLFNNLPGFDTVPPPKIIGVPLEFHEAYALAVFGNKSFDFTPFNYSSVARKLYAQKNHTLSLLKTAFVALTVILFIIGISMGGVIAVRSHLYNKLAPIRSELILLQQTTHQVDSLESVFVNQCQFSNRESRTTVLLTELQKVFPEGARADQIQINEVDNFSYTVQLVAIAYSTGLIPELMQACSAIPGVSGVRMAYSEQIAEARGQAVRLKVEFNWDSRHSKGGKP